MEEKNFEAKLAKLSHDIDQLDAKLEDRISSLGEELTKLILGSYLVQTIDTSVTYVDIGRVLAPKNLSEACGRARNEIEKLSEEYWKRFDEVSADKFHEDLLKFKARINTITRAAGLGQLWKV